ncbi:MAG: WG repeat-containing protein [Desmonostoc vinosum HA7617-LM4]|jgi:Zn-dependent protease|nr:WG repeat-containing protein [Desmonostoc vinosum HA7617-LM4]
MLALVSAIAFQIIHISQTEKLYPMSVLQKGYETKTENLYPVQFFMGRNRSGYAYVNQAAQLVVQPQFDYAGKFSEGFAPVRVNNKWGFINLQGQISISPQFDKVGESSSFHIDDDWLSSSFSEGLVGVKLNGKWGFINQSGKLVIPYQYDKVQQFSGGIATVKVNGLWGAINPEGKWIQPVFYKSRFELADTFSIQFFQGIATFRDPKTYRVTSYRDKSGLVVGDFNNPPKLAKEFQEELAIIKVPLWAKQQGRDVTPVVATSEYDFGYSAAEKCGFQNKQGKAVIEPQFDGCQGFSQGLAAVRVDEKWGYINRTGKFIISPQFDYADSFIEERALVVSNGKIGFINTTGKIVIKPEFQIDPKLATIYEKKPTFILETWKSLLQERGLQVNLSSIEKLRAQQFNPSSKEVLKSRFSNGLAAVAKDSKCGYIDKTGKFIIQPQFTECEQLDQYGVAQVVRQNGVIEQGNNWDEYLYINSEGKIFPKSITPNSLSKFYPARIKLLVSVMACLLWIVAISFHEFGHAIVAYWGGDRSVKDKGYLSFNPSRYINPLHSIILPGIFLVTGGIALPGAAVYIEFDEIRNRLWSSATAAAGPIASILFGLLLVPIFHFSIAGNLPHWFCAFIAIFINLQFFMALLNLLPIPPLDGSRIIGVWLPLRLRNRSGIISLIGLFFICFLLPFISIAHLLFLIPIAFTLALGISEEFSAGGWYLFDRWYTVLPLLIAGIVYLIYKPALILQFAGFVIEFFSPKAALKMYDNAIKIDPKSAWSWERKALILFKMETAWNCVKIIPAWEEAIKLDPHNRFSRRMFILDLRSALIWDKSFEPQLIEALEKYTELYAKDGWGWGVKALTLDELGNGQEALSAWEKNIKLDPSDRFKWRVRMKESTLEWLRS